MIDINSLRPTLTRLEVLLFSIGMGAGNFCAERYLQGSSWAKAEFKGVFVGLFCLAVLGLIRKDRQEPVVLQELQSRLNDLKSKLAEMNDVQSEIARISKTECHKDSKSSD